MSAPSRPTESLEALLAGTCQVDERELRDSLRTLIENVGGMTYRCLPDQSWTMLYVSESAEAITGYTVEDLLSGRQSYEALILPEDRPSVRDEVDAARATGRQFQISYRITDADGKLRWVWEQGQSVRHGDGREVLEGYIVDVSTQHRLSLRAEESQRLERIGLLAASLLHDVNNLMMPLMGNIELLAEDLDVLPTSARKNLLDMLSVSTRIRALLRSVRSLHHTPPAPSCIPDDALAGFALVLKNLLPDACTLDLQLSAPDVLVSMSAAGVERIALNLVQNAADAGARAVTLRTDDDGEALVLTVSDDGRGIPLKDQDRVFAPLFTTRDGGSGLGLSIVRRIARDAGGTVRAESAPGQGAAFTVRLPHHAEASTRASVILLLEANAFLRQQATALLSARGFRVLSCADNASALSKLRQGHRPDAVVTDMLSNRDREAFIERIRDARPDLPIHHLSEILTPDD